MHHVAVGRVLECVGEFQGDADRPRDVERPLLTDEVAQVSSLDELEDDVVPAFVAAHRVHAADVLVVEPGRRLGLVAEPAQHLGVG